MQNVIIRGSFTYNQLQCWVELYLLIRTKVLTRMVQDVFLEALHSWRGLKILISTLSEERKIFFLSGIFSYVFWYIIIESTSQFCPVGLENVMNLAPWSTKAVNNTKGSQLIQGTDMICNTCRQTFFKTRKIAKRTHRSILFQCKFLLYLYFSMQRVPEFWQ